MKVGLLTTEFPPLQGGLASYCLNLCNALSHGVEFHIFTISKKGISSDLIEETLGNSKHIRVHVISVPDGIYISTLRYQFSLAHKLPKFIKELNLDLIHPVAPHADILLRASVLKIPKVLTYHSTGFGQRKGTVDSQVRFTKLDSSEKKFQILYPFVRLFEKVSLARSKHIIAVSNYVRDQLITEYGYKEKITVIPNGIDINVFKPSKKKNNRKEKVLFTGQIIARKGVQFIIKAMPQVLKEHPDTVLVLAGTGNSGPYRRMLQDMKIPQRNFEFCSVDYQDMPQLYNQADIFVFPSLVESFPMSVLEAMACGLPAVASDVGDMPSLIKEGITGFMINKGDYNALANRINLLLDDVTLRTEMSQNARDLVVENYSAEIMGERTLKVYHQVLNDYGYH
jgi:glycosyltransferase involved in cell wall biosynthesis